MLYRLPAPAPGLADPPWQLPDQSARSLPRHGTPIGSTRCPLNLLRPNSRVERAPGVGEEMLARVSSDPVARLSGFVFQPVSRF